MSKHSVMETQPRAQCGSQCPKLDTRDGNPDSRKDPEDILSFDRVPLRGVVNSTSPRQISLRRLGDILLSTHETLDLAVGKLDPQWFEHPKSRTEKGWSHGVRTGCRS